ncbi:MAG TPA: hypothetical protein VK586_22400 [Streptosporangiaceae bacterium]|nr:hypothetical protein [Streptosporangiaceae bacterium]
MPGKQSRSSVILSHGPRRLGGAVYGQPLVIGATVIAATEFELGESAGRVRQRIALGSALPRFVSPHPVGLILVGTLSGVVAVSGA